MIFKNTRSEVRRTRHSCPSFKFCINGKCWNENLGLDANFVAGQWSGHQTAAGRELQTPAAGGGLVTSDQ